MSREASTRIAGARPHGGAAYSLIEVILTLSIIGVMAAIALPRMANSASSSRVDAAAATAASLIETARDTAVATSTSVRLTFGGSTIDIAVVNPESNTAADVSDLLAVRPLAEEIMEIGTTGDAALLPAQDREQVRARRATLLALQERSATLTRQAYTATTSRHTLPWDALIQSADFGGDHQVTFNGHGVPDSGGAVVIRVGGQRRTVTLDAGAGTVSVTP